MGRGGSKGDHANMGGSGRGEGGDAGGCGAHGCWASCGRKGKAATRSRGEGICTQHVRVGVGLR